MPVLGWEVASLPTKSQGATRPDACKWRDQRSWSSWDPVKIRATHGHQFSVGSADHIAGVRKVLGHAWCPEDTVRCQDPSTAMKSIALYFWRVALKSLRRTYACLTLLFQRSSKTQ